jgi:hypothetical protein
MRDNERPCVLNVGLHPDLVTEMAATREALTSVTASQVWRGLDASRAAVAEMGLDFDNFLVSHGMEVDQELRRKLHGRHYALIVVGGGVRLDPAVTHLFEVLVNAVMSVSPTSVLCFNTGPDKTIEAIRRWWPEPAALPAI